MKIGYRAGYRDGYQQSLADCKEQLERSVEHGARVAYRHVLDRIMSPLPEGVTRVQWVVSVAGELEEALRSTG